MLVKSKINYPRDRFACETGGTTLRCCLNFSLLLEFYPVVYGACQWLALVAGGWEGGLAIQTKKLKARKLPKKRGAYPPSVAYLSRCSGGTHC
jgi:hypothetical protein